MTVSRRRGCFGRFTRYSDIGPEFLHRRCCWPRGVLGNQTAGELQLELCLDGPAVTTLQTVFPGGAGRWGVRRTRIREHGLPLELVVISDLTQALSEQELQAWQRLVRVLGHELNNSLTPIKSIAGSLETIVMRQPLPEDWRDDMRRGLSVIMSRSDSLSRFIGAYARLAKLPRPQLQPLSVTDCVGRAVSFETRLPVQVEAGDAAASPSLAVISTSSICAFSRIRSTAFCSRICT